MRGAIALLAVLYGARGEYPCAKEGVTNCSAVTYDDPFARGDKPTTFTGEKYTDDFFCLPKKWQYKPGGFDETLFSTISPRHLSKGFIFERNKWESHDIMTEREMEWNYVRAQAQRVCSLGSEVLSRARRFS